MGVPAGILIGHLWFVCFFYHYSLGKLDGITCDIIICIQLLLVTFKSLECFVFIFTCINVMSHSCSFKELREGNRGKKIENTSEMSTDLEHTYSIDVFFRNRETDIEFRPRSLRFLRCGRGCEPRNNNCGPQFPKCEWHDEEKVHIDI
jgi:hypothetical protein